MKKGDKVKCKDTDRCEPYVKDGVVYTVKEVVNILEEDCLILQEIPVIAYSSIFFELVE